MLKLKDREIPIKDINSIEFVEYLNDRLCVTIKTDDEDIKVTYEDMPAEETQELAMHIYKEVFGVKGLPFHSSTLLEWHV